VRGNYNQKWSGASSLFRGRGPSGLAAACALLVLIGDVPADQLKISSVRPDNASITLEFDYPSALMNENWDVFSFDGDGVSYDGMAAGWELAEPAFLLTGAVFSVWNDSGQNGRLPVSDVANRFYAVGSLLADQDTDGLSDARELFLYHTDPEDSDSDHDLLSDYDEQVSHGTDPNNADTDGDSVDDGTEVAQGRSPFAGAVQDTSGILNLVVHTPNAP